MTDGEIAFTEGLRAGTRYRDASEYLCLSDHPRLDAILRHGPAGTDDDFLRGFRAGVRRRQEEV